MRPQHLRYLECPKCHVPLEMGSIGRQVVDRIEEGHLLCPSCAMSYPIVNFIPRFVGPENYASGFGLQWNIHDRTQYDMSSGVGVSEHRFFQESGWPRNLDGQTILEVGSGSGRFTIHAASTGAMVVSMDFSGAVEANYRSNGQKENVLIVQADIYAMPFPRRFFDKAICIGVLQHTPDVRRSFMTLTSMVRPGGSLVADVYKKPRWYKAWFYTKYWVRPLLRGLEPVRLYAMVERYVCAMWPLARIISKIPLGRQINWWLLIADYRGVYQLSEDQLKQWAILDTFDMLAPAYDSPQTLETFRSWFAESGLEDIDVHYGYNGIEGRARVPETII